MSDEYLLWTAKNEPHACTLRDIEGFDKIFELMKGISQAGKFPSDVKMKMDERKPNDTLLVDNVKNLKNILVISERLKSFLEAKSINNLEYLPITILDHKGRPIEQEYFILNPINNPDCLDLNVTDPEWSQIDDTLITHVKKLAVQKEWRDDNHIIFRPKFYRSRPFVSAKLAQEITEGGFTGVRWQPISEVTGRLN